MPSVKGFLNLLFLTIFKLPVNRCLWSLSAGFGPSRFQDGVVLFLGWGGGWGVCGGSQGVWDWLWFSCGVAHGEGSLVPVFHGFSVSVGRNFILARGLGAGLAFYGVWAHS